jgi:putative ABC transport system ATP-binding protein
MAHGTIPILRLENLCYEAGGKAIVREVSVEVRRGDFFAVVGPSGAGKSTLLRLLNRLDEPSGGTVYLEGRDYRQLPPAELRRRVGMVMQAANLFPGTVADNLRFGPQQRGEEVSEETIAGLLERVGLSGYEERDVSNLSGGEAQRVSLARTLANTPEILLLDEPTSALDDAARQDVEELICSIVCGQELTALMVTHDMEQAVRMVNQVIVLEKGRLVRSGSIEEALHAE